MRKTVKLHNLVVHVNNMLKSKMPRDGKIALCMLIEDVLMDAKAYRGFQFHNSDSAPGDNDYYDRTYFCAIPKKKG